MSTTSPQKRRATAMRSSSMLNQPMRQTRSMAKISDLNHFTELSSTSRLVEQRHHPPSSSSSHPRNHSPRKARASQAAELESFDPDTPDTSLAACMESPVKGRFDDFEFELETSNPEMPTRRRRIAPPRQSSPSDDVGLPRSMTSTKIERSSAPSDNTLMTSRKENSPKAPSEPFRPSASPVKPVAALPRASRLHGPTPSLRTSSQTAAPSSNTLKSSIPDRASSAKPLDGSASDSKPVGSSRDSGHLLVFGSSGVKSDASVKRNPFIDDADANSLAMLGEPRHSPVKRFQAKSEFIISSPDRPDRKPINLLELKPSPGKAQRGIFRHNSAHDDEDDDDDDWDEGSNTVDEIRLVKGPAPRRDEAVDRKDQLPSSSGSTASASSSSTAKKHFMPRSTTTLDVKHTLSSETSDALASLEASLARLKAKTRSPPSSGSTSSGVQKKQDSVASADTAHKRELGTARPFGMTSSRTMNFRTAKSTVAGSDSSSSARSNAADQSSDSGAFKRPSGRISALAKSRETSSDLRSVNNPSLASSKSMMSFGAPRLPDFSGLAGKSASRPPVSGSRTSSLELASSSFSRAEEDAAQEEEEARVAEAKRQAEIKAAKRRSMSSLSSGMPPPQAVHRRESENARSSTATAAATNKPSAARSASASSSSSSGAASSSNATTAAPSRPPTEAELAEARQAAKAARRRSLYTFVPTKREDGDADRSTGNVSANLLAIGTATDGSEGDASASAPKKQRFLRGLTVLVDVRDQDGEDASACWIDMLKNAGAKVMVRFGERKLTHIVYKSGRPSTLHSYRALEDPKPHVVGIGWVVACLEQGQKADEKPYLVEVAKQAIFAQRRRSLLAPKQAPASANIAIWELPEEQLKNVEEARRKLLAHAPAVPSPLRRKISSRTVLVSRFARTSLDSSPSGSVDGASGQQTSTLGDKKTKTGDNDAQEDALLESYRKRVGSVLSPRSAAVLA
ncbi:BRCT domain-containing protein [Pseudozyma hubeiensis]|nr:BRCT domain-containing protein [Pseudozyma hubeiensis]